MTVGALLAVGLVAYGTAINVAPLPDRLYVAANVAVGAVVVAVALTVPGVDLAAVGLAAPHPVAVAVALVLAAAAAVGVVGLLRLAGRSARVAGLLADERVRGSDTATIVERAVVRIPVGTAAFEEVAFRGTLLAVVAAEAPVPAAVAVSSAAFGLWHLAPTWRYLEANRVRGRAVPLALAVVGTAAAGAVLCGLRLLTGGLLVPWVAHGATNVGALVAAHAHQRRRTPAPRGRSHGPSGPAG